MKNKLFNHRLSFFIMPRIHRNVLAWVKPDSVSERSKRAIENILHSEEDGGKMIEINHSTLDQKRKKRNG